MAGIPDQEARFRELVDEDVCLAVWRFSYRLTGNRLDAEDLAQESLARAFLRLHQLRHDHLVKGWLFSIVRSRFIEGRRRKRFDIVGDEFVNLPTEDRSPLGRVVRDFVAKLPPVQREAIELFHFDELSLAETAQVLGVGVNTVKQRLHRARESLKRMLAPNFAAGDLEVLL